MSDGVPRSGEIEALHFVKASVGNKYFKIELKDSPDIRCLNSKGEIREGIEVVTHSFIDRSKSAVFRELGTVPLELMSESSKIKLQNRLMNYAGAVQNVSESHKDFGSMEILQDAVKEVLKKVLKWQTYEDTPRKSIILMLGDYTEPKIEDGVYTSYKQGVSLVHSENMVLREYLPYFFVTYKVIQESWKELYRLYIGFSCMVDGYLCDMVYSFGGFKGCDFALVAVGRGAFKYKYE